MPPLVSTYLGSHETGVDGDGALGLLGEDTQEAGDVRRQW